MASADLITGISCLHLQWRSLPECFQRVRELGLQVLELSTGSVEPPQYELCAELARKHDLRVSLHGWSDPARLSPREAVADLEAHLEICRQLTARHLVMHLGSHPQRAVGLERLAHVCRAVAPAFEQAGVTLCLENHYPYSYGGLHELGGEPADFDLLFDLSESPYVRFCLDYGHSHMARNTGEFIERLAPYLAYTHLADNLGEHDDHLGPEEGTVDWPDVLGRTLATGFRGPFVIEFPEKGDPGRFRRFMQTLHALARAHDRG